uniref:Ras-related protein Rab-36 n=1 Tax=Amphilophus citrinellus TaxID=61819 RepID=A0A3Q0QR63_AMPCI
MQASREQMMLPDRVIREFPQCYTPESSLQLKKDWDIQAIVACNNRGARPQLWDPNKMSKVVVVGDFNVGKTCILKRFCKNVFLRGYKATIGVDFEIERFDICGVPFSLQIWDTAGQERFSSVASAFYRGAMVIVSVFDMANIKSLDHARQWLQESLKENEPESVSIFLVGNKTDLLPRQERWRTEKDAISIAKEMNAEFWAVSAKTGENIQDFFFRVAALAFESCVLKEVRSAVHAGIGPGDDIDSKSPSCVNIHFYLLSCCE